MQHCPARAAQRLAAAVLALVLLLCAFLPHAHAAELKEKNGIRLLSFDTSHILSIGHLKNTTVSGVKRHTNRTSTYEYHLTSSGWNEVNYPHIATSSTYGHWVCVAGISPTADPENLTESDFYALDPARVTANGRLAVTRLLDHTLWVENSPLKVLG